MKKYKCQLQGSATARLLGLILLVLMSGCTFQLIYVAADEDSKAVLALLEKGADANAPFQ